MEKNEERLIGDVGDRKCKVKFANFKESDQRSSSPTEMTMEQRCVGRQEVSQAGIWRKVFQEENSRCEALRQVYIPEVFKDDKEPPE